MEGKICIVTGGTSGIGKVAAREIASRGAIVVIVGRDEQKGARAAAEIRKVVDESGLADLVEANARFTRAQIPGQNTLLGVVYVQRREGVSETTEEIKDELTREIQTRLLDQGFNITPLISVNVLEAPP